MSKSVTMEGSKIKSWILKEYNSLVKFNNFTSDFETPRLDALIQSSLDEGDNVFLKEAAVCDLLDFIKGQNCRDYQEPNTYSPYFASMINTLKIRFMLSDEYVTKINQLISVWKPKTAVQRLACVAMIHKRAGLEIHNHRTWLVKQLNPPDEGEDFYR